MNPARALCWFGRHQFTRWRRTPGTDQRQRRCKRCNVIETQPCATRNVPDTNAAGADQEGAT